MNTCMAQLPGKCENALILPSCLDGSSSGMQSEIYQREWTKSTRGAVEGRDDMLHTNQVPVAMNCFISVLVLLSWLCL